MVAMRDGDWKIMAMLKKDTTYLPKIYNLYDGNEALVKGAELTDHVLYNLNDNMSETDDLSLSHSEEFSRMKNLLDKEYRKLLEGSHIWKREE